MKNNLVIKLHTNDTSKGGILSEAYTESALSDLVKEELLRDFYFCKYMDQCVLKNKTIELPLTKLSGKTKDVLSNSTKEEIQDIIYRAIREILLMTFQGQIDDLEKEKRIRVRLV